MIFLSGTLVRLRAMENEDLDLLLRIENDSEEWVQSENYFPFSKAILESYIKADQNLFTSGQYRFIIEELVSNAAIGCIDLFAYSPVHMRAGVGVFILKKERAKGYAKEALSLLENHAREVLNLELLYCSILSTNKASIQLFQRNGFLQTGERRGWTKIKGERISALLYQKNL